MRIQILILDFKGLSAGVQGLDSRLGLSWRTPIMVWIIKNGVFTLLSSEYRTRARSVNSLKAGFTRATHMQMQEQTTFTRRTQT